MTIQTGGKLCHLPAALGLILSLELLILGIVKRRAAAEWEAASLRHLKIDNWNSHE